MVLIIFLLTINIIAFFLYGIDKKKAIDGKFRISEATLITLAVIGGAFGAFLGMKVFHHKTKKKKFTFTVPVFVLIWSLFIGVIIYGNYHLVVTEYEYKADTDLKIVQISDLHNQFFGFNECILLDRIKKLEPDMIVVTGDVVDSHHTCYSLAEDFFKGAVEIAPVYYVTGNHEAWKLDSGFDEFISNIEAMGVHFLDGKREELDDVVLVGTYRNAMANVPEFQADGKLKILLAHDPMLYEEYKQTGADIVFTGHVHGGQIIIPGKGGLLSPDVSFFPKLYEGEHHFDDMTMYISRGLGNSAFPIRVNDDPEIVVVNVKR